MFSRYLVWPLSHEVTNVARSEATISRSGLRRLSILSLVAAVGCAVLVGGCGRAGAAAAELSAQEVAELRAAERSETVLSKVFRVDQKYRSMMGPHEIVELQLGSDLSEGSDDILWITGYRAEMVSADGKRPMPQEFMCHSNLDIDVASHQETLDVDISFSPRLFTLSQGQLEIDFPSGYGIPVHRRETMALTTQVLNLNHDAPKIDVRHRVTVTYVPDSATAGRMRALQPVAAYGLALTEGESGHFGVEAPEEEVHGPGCLVEQPASDHSYEDGLGRVFTGHWQVPPGRQENRTLVTHLMNVPYETEMHYVAVHLHPFAESLELRDLTADKVLFRAEASQFPGKIGLAEVDHFSDPDGVLVYPDHEYELVSVYRNTSGETQDSMAVMYIYLRDRRVEERIAELRGRGV
ncbi:MAG: hypothetical protein MPN21_05855 [Thermoanaerobaculia bacterium]|nr:hypothetical protein [Thermoanaerobaculia bacterium]